MSVTSGFFDSLSNDRRYSSLQFSSLFDGLINDGIFSTVGNAFAVTKAVGAENERTITVDTGRAWFNHTWTLNDALLPLVGDEAELLLDRIDAVILDIDSREEVRNNSIKIIKGTPASNPVRPTLISSQYRNQYALAYIRRPNKQSRGTEGDTIRSSDITSVIGSTNTPFVTGILQTLSINTLLTQYDEEVNELIAMLRRNIEDASSGGVLEGSVTTEKIAQEAVTTEKYAPQSVTRAKLANDALYSPVVTINSNIYNVQASDLGKTLYPSYDLRNGNNVINLTQAISQTLPIGAEIAILRLYDNNDLTIVTSDIRIVCTQADVQLTNKSFIIPQKGGMVALKRLTSNNSNGDIWILTGSAEVTV